MRKATERKAIQMLTEARETLTMKNARFGNIFNPEKEIILKEKDVDAFIKERTKIWRRSWIDYPMGEVIEFLKGKEYIK